MTLKILQYRGSRVRCPICGQLYLSAEEARDGFDNARGGRACPRCEATFDDPGVTYGKNGRAPLAAIEE